MLPATPYSAQGYPPAGRQWLHFGDPKLDEAIASLSQEMHSNLAQKRQPMHHFHLERLQYNDMAPRPVEPPPPQAPTHYQMDSDNEEEPARDAAEISEPSGMRRFAKEYAWPITRDIVAPAMGDMAVSGLKGAAWLTGKALWTVVDILGALGGGEQAEQETSALGYGSSAAALGNGGGASSSSDEPEVERLAKKTKTALMEEIYKQPGWANLFGMTDSRGYTKEDKGGWRRKMRDMSQHDLAEILVKLERGS